MNLSFDDRGYLKPYDPIKIDFRTFKEYFLDSFNENSTRHQIFEGYMRFLTTFKSQVSTNFIQWVNGSFVSTKENPKDIDFVTIIDHQIFEEHEKLIEEKFRLRGARKSFGVDAYTVRKYPKNHNNYIIYQHELVYWNNWFTSTKYDRAKKKFGKGFIEIKFGDSKL